MVGATVVLTRHALVYDIEYVHVTDHVETLPLSHPPSQLSSYKYHTYIVSIAFTCSSAC